MGVVLAAVLLASCARKAPSPEQCVSFTELLVGATNDQLLTYPTAKAQFDAVVTACLTLPFEPRVFSCVDETRAPTVCIDRYVPELKISRAVELPTSNFRRGPARP